MGVGIGAFAVRKRQRREAHKVVRKFFGDSAPPKPRFDVTQQLGVQEPLGFWDPLGLAADGDEATFKRRRAVEIKHGRVCMYATIGYIVPEYFKFPGYLSPSTGLKFEDVPNGLAALSKVPLYGWLQIFAFAGAIETTGFFSGSAGEIGFQKDSTESGEPGNYGIGFPNFVGKVDDAEARKTKLAAELANGRLAMMAIIGMFFQDGLTGSAWGDWALYTASPLRAEESTTTRMVDASFLAALCMGAAILAAPCAVLAEEAPVSKGEKVAAEKQKEAELYEKATPKYFKVKKQMEMLENLVRNTKVGDEQGASASFTGGGGLGSMPKY